MKDENPPSAFSLQPSSFPMSELSSDKILTLYLQISQYPILARQIRHRMRGELFRRGVITAQHLEQEAREKAILSQHREGLTDPYAEEEEGLWQQRLGQIRDYLTDFYFAYNLPVELFHHIVEDLLSERDARRGTSLQTSDIRLTFNPELAPVDLNIRQATQYEALPADERAKVRHHLEEIIVVLIKTMISDQLSFISRAKAWFTAADFEFIQSRRIGSGKIGGKSAGMLLAWKILQAAAPEVAQDVTVPRSYFVGADVFYDFKALNELEYINQKYKPVEQIRAEFPEVLEAHLSARFPEEVADRLREILREVGRTPLIVRSSSLLEDNFGTSFAGKYDSYFCPNQGAPKENLRDLTMAIRRIYASVYSPDVLIYRRRMGLLDYDERMAILLQEVQGETQGRYFFPALAGVAFSQSPIVWSPRLRREEGFVRLVMGLGTRAVERVGEDYPRLVFLSHPQLRPENSPDAIAHYSQHLVDVIDLKDNTFATVPLEAVLNRDHSALRWVASVKSDGTLLPVRRLGAEVTPDRLVLTFDNLLQRTDFTALLKSILSALAQRYGFAVDVEFALSITPDPGGGRPRLKFHLLQCRPQSLQSPQGESLKPVPTDVPLADQLFLATHMVPQGQVTGIEYLVYVDPVAYHRLADPARRTEVARLVGQLNKALEDRDFILIGPGRWGSSNRLLGVPISYADIYNARALIELTIGPEGNAPDPSYGTHFFQDLVEARIYSLAVHPVEAGDYWNASFFESSGNALKTLLPEADNVDGCVRVIHAPSERHGQRVALLMDGEKALAFFANG